MFRQFRFELASVLLFLRKEANILVLVGKKPAELRLNKDGKSFLEAKSPVAPKMTTDVDSWRTWRRDGSGISKRYFNDDDICCFVLFRLLKWRFLLRFGRYIYIFITTLDIISGRMSIATHHYAHAVAFTATVVVLVPVLVVNFKRSSTIGRGVRKASRTGKR